LRSFASGRDENRRLGIKLGGHTKQIAVERSAQALIGGDQNYCSFPDVALFEQRMTELAHPGRGFTLNAVKEVGKGTAGQRGLLRFAHF
jgi:hypothetical protein